MTTTCDEFVKAARIYCALLDDYDRKSTPIALRKMTIARTRMRELYAKVNADERAFQSP